MIGKAVALSAVASPFMKVFGFTRQADIDDGHSGNNIRGVEYTIGNMLEYETVLKACRNMDVIFFSSFFWESMNSKTEYYQGRNVVNAAVECGVKHIIYAGTDFNTINSNEDMCPCFEAKARISDFIVYMGIPYTIVRMSWFYENFLSVFRPHPTSRMDYALALPLGGRGLNMGSIKDFAKCITLIALRPAKTIQRTINLAATYLTVADMAKILNDNFPNLHFYDPQITLLEYQKLDFRGADELSAMFRHFQRQVKWDSKVMIEFAFSSVSFEDWVCKSKQEIRHILDEQLDEMSLFSGLLVVSGATVLEEGDLLMINERSRTRQKGKWKEKKDLIRKKLLNLKPMENLKILDTVGVMLGTIKESQV